MRLPILAGLAAFLFTAAAVKQLLPRSDGRLAGHLRQLRSAQYTTVFLGTSCFYRGIVPSVFDEELGRAGVQSRSFNLSAPGMSWGEAAQLANQIIDRGIAYLVVDGDLRAFDEEGAAARRFVDWHDASTTALAIRSLPFAISSAHYLGEDVRGFLFHSLGVGVVSDRLVGEADEVVTIGEQGFVSLDSCLGDQSFRERLDGFHSNLSEYWQDVADLNHGRQRVMSASRIARWIVDRARDAGVKTVIVYPPNVLHDEVESDAPQLDFREPKRYAELYDVDARFDFNHLNERGAKLFTRRLAERFVEWRDAVR